MEHKSNPAGWFEIPVTDMERARDFYNSVFGWQLQTERLGSREMAWFPRGETGYEVGGALVRGQGYLPAQTGVVIYLRAPDIEATLDRVQSRGGRVLARKIPMGACGYVAFFSDSEGNRIGIHAVN